MRHHFRTLCFACWVLAACAPVPAFASAGETRATAPAPDVLGKARSLVLAGRWPEAMEELKRINATGDPDWNNLMGVTSRRSDPPDFAAAERYYNAALAINPKHRPTLEYLGELRLQQGDLPAAQAVLERLRKTTFFKSEEYGTCRTPSAATRRRDITSPRPPRSLPRSGWEATDSAPLLVPALVAAAEHLGQEALLGLGEGAIADPVSRRWRTSSCCSAESRVGTATRRCRYRSPRPRPAAAARRRWGSCITLSAGCRRRGAGCRRRRGSSPAAPRPGPASAQGTSCLR